LCNVELVLWSRLRVGFAHISNPVVSDLPGYIWRRGGAVGDMSHDAHLGRSTQEKIASKKAQKVIF
jgi:hypothetical protein